MTGLVCPSCDEVFETDKRVARADVTECKFCHKKFVVTQKTLKTYQKPQPVPPQPIASSVPPSQVHSKISCPNCATVLEGQITTGQIVECPDCHKQFEATPERLNAPTVLARAAPTPTADSSKPKSITGKLALIFLGLMALFAFIMPDSEKSTSNNSNATPDAAQQTPAPAQPARDPNDIKNFLSSWDGSNRELVKLVKSAMNDPKSFEHVETRFIDRGNSLKLFMTYRGKNAFNATVTNKVSADFDKATRQLSNIEQP